MLAAVVQFPGSNADFDAYHTLSHVMGVRTEYVFHRSTVLPTDVDLVVLPGGFSYGDYLRCGAIARFANIMAAVRAHADRGGLVLGICNGFQVLTEAGMLPGALTRNEHLRFECRDVSVRVEVDGPFTQDLRGRTLRLPVAHAEGRYYADTDTLSALERDRLVAFRYVDANDGNAANPNGSLHNIAGLYGGPRRNVLGLMPHPERAAEPILGSADGRLIFHSVVRAALAR
jgi:phosphoribosylformylglycinamidine synthase subunit PurQ / glutaminase